jgi:hypothetical protein
MPLTRIQSLGITDGTIVNADINASAAIAGTKLSGAGKVLQVLSTTKTDTFATNPNSTFIDVTGLSVSITPSSASNKILIQISISGGGTIATNIAHFRLVRDSTAICLGDAASNRTRGFANAIDSDANAQEHVSGLFLDSPNTTSSTTYKIQTFSNDIVYVNKSANDTDASTRSRTASTITVMEIAA